MARQINSRPAISILIPIYNVEKYLRQCLDSVINQTLDSIEIICINDGSTDHSLDIIQEYAKKDHRIVILNKSNSGYGDSMNQALDFATGEYIGIVESDDWIEPEAFKTLYDAAVAESADVAKANYFKFKTQKPSLEKLGDKPIIAHHKLFVNNGVYPELFHFAPAIWSAIYRRQFLLDNEIRFLPTPGASYQDLSFSFKIWVLAKRIVLLPEAFLHYRIDNANSSIHNQNKLNCVVDEYGEIAAFLRDRNLLSRFSGIMEATKFRNYHWNFQRLDAKMAKQFYQTWHQDLLTASQNGTLRRGDFSIRDWAVAQFIIKAPRLSYRILRARVSLLRPFRS